MTKKPCRILFLMRGPSGSGKTFEANRIRNDAERNQRSCLIVSADDYFMRRMGDGSTQYVFDFNKLGVAHEQCRSRVRDAMIGECEMIIVDNTNITVRDMLPYFDLALKHDYEIRFREPKSPWWLHIRSIMMRTRNPGLIKRSIQPLVEKSVHGVPLYTIANAILKFQSSPDPIKALKNNKKDREHNYDRS